MAIQALKSEAPSEERARHHEKTFPLEVRIEQHGRSFFFLSLVDTMSLIIPKE
jgi:hypothetical protein